MTRWLVPILLATVVISGCHPALVSTDPERLFTISDLPLPVNWLPQAPEYWEETAAARTISENWLRPWNQPDESRAWVGFRVWVARYRSLGQARRGSGEVMRRHREHGCNPVRPAGLFPYTGWADDCIACQNRQNQGMTYVIWRYRNIMVEGRLQESAEEKVADISGLFSAVDRHLQTALVSKSP